MTSPILLSIGILQYFGVLITNMTITDNVIFNVLFSYFNIRCQDIHYHTLSRSWILSEPHVLIGNRLSFKNY